MAISQIDYMNVVAYPCSIMGGVVIAEYCKLFELAYAHLADVGKQVVGDPIGILPD
ncbi:hypothetical protein D3C76_1603170 [compost metagenome]